MAAAPSVSIVIPAFNEEDTIGPCLVAAVLQTVPAAEILVIDNRSTDRTAEVVRELQAEYPDAPIVYLRQDEEQGLVPTRNLGLDRATGDVLGRIDADSIIDPDWVEVVSRTFADGQVDAATGPVLYYDMPLRRLGLRADDRIRQAILRLTSEYHFLFGSNMAIRATAWADIRSEVCRDEDDELHEDIDISVHLTRRDHRIAYVSAMVSGMSARRLEGSPRDYGYYAMRFDRTYARHGIHAPVLRAPMLVFLAIYPMLKPIHVLRQKQDSVLARFGGPAA